MTEAAVKTDQVVTVGIVDDHHVLTEALSLVIRREPDLRVVGTADSCAAARTLFGRTCPDVILLDVSLPDGNGLSLVPEFKRICQDTYILVLTSLTDEKTLLRAINTGVSGFIGKNRPLVEVLAAIRQAAEGEIVMPSSLLVGLLARTPRGRPDSPDQQKYEPLTPREEELLRYMAQGKSGKSIAAELSISHMTVRTHIRNLMGKLGVHSRLEAVTFALQHGLIEPPT